MRFPEATIENSGCNAKGTIHYFKRTARFRSKEYCPNGKFRCCIFCPDEQCKLRCELGALLERQPESVKNTFECCYLQSSLDLAWKVLFKNGGE